MSNTTRINITDDSSVLPEGEYYLGREGIHVLLTKNNITNLKGDNIDDKLLRAKIKAVGLDLDELFSGSRRDMTFHYVISHRDDIVASKINMYHKAGFAYLIPDHDVDDLFHELPVTLDVAREFLITGYHSDIPVHENKLLRLGEFVICKTSDGNTVEIYSESYAWRKKIRDNELKVRHGFYKHLTLAMKAKKQYHSKKDSIKADYHEYINLFPTIPYVEPRSIEGWIQSHGFILTWPEIGKLVPSNYIYNTWACYLHALPLHLHSEARNLYNDYFKVCEICNNYIISVNKDGFKPVGSMNSVDNIDSIAIRRINDIIKQSNKNILDGSGGSFEKNCGNLIKKERGSSLFAIHEYISKYHQ